MEKFLTFNLPSYVIAGKECDKPWFNPDLITDFKIKLNKIEPITLKSLTEMQVTDEWMTRKALIIHT